MRLFSRFILSHTPSTANASRLKRITMAVATIGFAVALTLRQTGVVHSLHQDVIRNTVGFAPEQFYQALDISENAAASNGLLTIAHNAGDRQASAQTALNYGADVIEVDVISIGNSLFAAHDIPNEHLSSVIFRGPTLESIWSTVADQARIEFDLKEYSAGFIDLLVSFLNDRGGGDGVIISSRSPGAIATLHQELPGATLVYSIGDRASIASLRSSETLVEEIDGVSIRASLLDDDTMTWLKDHDLLVYAWTVDDFASAERLVELGVDGFATNNLALLEHYDEGIGSVDS